MSEIAKRGPVTTTIAGAHARIELNRPARRNAIDLSLVRALSEILADLSNRDDIRIVTLSGRGKSFCAGADVDEFTLLASMSSNDREDVFEEHWSMLEQLSSLPQVTVAVVHGVTAGLGISLVGRCDLALGAESAQFVLPELELGVVPALVLVDVYERMHAKTAADWLFLGQPRSAQEALNAGLLSRVVDDDLLSQTAEETVARLANFPAGAVRRTLQFARVASSGNGAVLRSIAVSGSAAGVASEEARRGVEAFQHRRAATNAVGRPG